MNAIHRLTGIAIVFSTVLLWVPLLWADELHVGLAARDITPEVGYSHYRGVSTGVDNPLQVKAIVLQQGDQSAALIICDLIGIPRSLSVRVRSLVAEATDIPYEHITVAATHIHSGPSYYGDLREYVEAEQSGNLTEEHRDSYVGQLIHNAAGAAIDAYEGTVPMSIELVRAEEHNVSFNRRYLMRDGQVRFNPGFLNPEVVRPVGPIDPEILTVLFHDAEGVPRGGLSNFANHTDTVGTSQYSADYPHYLAESLREELGESFLSVFGLGAAGDINHFDVMNVAAQDRLTSREIGEALGAAVRSAVAQRQSEQPALAVMSRTIFIPLQDYTEEELAWAEAFDGSEPLYREAERSFIQQRRASKIRSLQTLREREAIAPSASGQPWHIPVEIHAIRLSSETALVSLTTEVFVELGLDLKQRSPFPHTLPITMANIGIAYVPTKEAFRQGDYEAINSRLAPGGGEQMIDAAVEMLHELAEDQ